MPKLLHTADIHLDSPLQAGLPESVAATVREGLFETLARLVETANDERVDAMLIAGDLFDSPTPSRSVAERAFELLGRSNAPVFISPGNHDYLLPRSPYLMLPLPENVHVFRSEQIEAVDLGDFVVYGAGFRNSTVSCPMLDGFHADTDKPSVMVIHGETAIASAQYHPISTESIAASGLDYLALGHIHNRSEPQTAGKTVYAYCGTPANKSFRGIPGRGAYIVELGRPSIVRFFPTDARRFVTIESDTPSIPDGYERDLVRLIVTGEHEHLDTDALERELAPRAFYVKVVDHTRLPMKIWQRADEDTLAGAFLGALQAERERGEDDELVELAARFGLAALDREEAPL